MVAVGVARFEWLSPYDSVISQPVALPWSCISGSTQLADPSEADLARVKAAWAGKQLGAH
jgi:hypothetical protein